MCHSPSFAPANTKGRATKKTLRAYQLRRTWGGRQPQVGIL